MSDLLQQTPRFSVVIPTCGRPDRLADVLDRLDAERQGLPPAAFEVIVSDDGDDGEDDDARQRLGARVPQVRWLRGPRRGPAANRNHGARQARGAWLLFTDDDCQPDDGWIRAIAACADTDALDVIEGKIIAVGKRESLFRRDVENMTGDCFWSANLAVRRSYFEQLGGFDEDFGEAGGEDLELAHRFRVGAARTRFCGDAIVRHPSHVMTWRQVIAFAFRIRWHALYRLKTSQAPPAGAPIARVVAADVATESMRLLRTTWRSLTEIGSRPIGPVIARTALDWALFPILMPYVVYWDLRFRAAAVPRTR